MMSTPETWSVRPPVPKAPPGYVEPPARHDTVDVLVIIDRSQGFEPLESPPPLTHPIDQFAGDLKHHLEVLRNIVTLTVTTEEIRYEEDLPTRIYAVVTNDVAYAEWCRSWGGTLVMVDLVGDSLLVEYGDEAELFGPDDLKSAVRLAMGVVEYGSGADRRDAGPALLEPISAEEIAGTEPILAELWRAIDNDELTDGQRAQIQAMAELLKAQRIEMIPGQTERWKLVGPMRSVLRYLMKEAPRDVLAWWKVAELLAKINWSTLASMLPV